MKKIIYVIIILVNSLISISNERQKDFELFSILSIKENINFRFLSDGFIIREENFYNNDRKQVGIFSQTNYDLKKIALILEEHNKTCMSSIYKKTENLKTEIFYPQNEKNTLEDNIYLITIKNCTFSFKLDNFADEELENFFFYISSYKVDGI